ncbi:helix-turn-helix transcriptional regulator [Sulfitobacter sp. OXR-159]|uniref:helix-turn-helix domain-containing protein n=1 Tax=Sulfitobacter sp. OXR-159 TaxID=3100174 RepID=UPI002AC89589|nr:helix-turn-helix transcriptional regulator [Sulfitobacter sp. OXR-159]WPZ30726.1 helix-turn-helix transcriptional regulator [Sulfitobacter sp. OXR-159]WPZ30827.1 helix-turn-helix transcriptional regulator [Sulfitobacter sp. OXR-159]
MLVAKNIKDLMQARHMDAAKLARAAEINPTGIYDILSGKSQSPKIVTLAKIAKGLNVPLAALFETATDLELKSDIIALFERLPAPQRELLLKTAQAWSEALEEPQSSAK